MIDPKVFNELMNRGIVTQVGLNPEDYKDITDLQRYGIATSIGAVETYEDVVSDLVNIEEVIAKFLADVKAGGNVVVPMSLNLTAPIVVEKDVTIDLNGYTLTNTPWDEEGESNAYMFWVKSGKLTLNGEGTVSVPDAIYSMAVWANGGDVEINGGTYMNGGDSCDLIYASKKGNIVINNGIFKAAGPASGTAPGTKNPYSALNIKDANKTTCSISVKGGKFYMFDPVDNLSENPKMNFCSTGYTSVANGDYFEVLEGVKTEEELKKVVANGGTVKLLADISLTDYIEVRKSVVVDLNGHKIVHPLNSPSKYPDVFEVMTGGKLTINGEGDVVAENGYSVYAAGDAVVEINGGNYMSPVSTVDARKNAHVTINAGTFKVDGSNNPDGDFGQKFTLNLRDKVGNYVNELSEISVKGGRFYKYNPSASESENPVANFCAKGYEAIANGDWYEVIPAKEIVVDEAE